MGVAQDSTGEGAGQAGATDPDAIPHFVDEGELPGNCGFEIFGRFGGVVGELLFILKEESIAWG